MDILTIRNEKVINHEGFQYVFDKILSNGITESYRCRRRDLNCKGRIHITGGNIMVRGVHGGHEESPSGIEVRMINSKIIKKN